MAEKEENLPKKFSRRALLANVVYGVSTLMGLGSIFSSYQVNRLNREGEVLWIVDESPQTMQEKIKEINAYRETRRYGFGMAATGLAASALMTAMKAGSIENERK